MATESGVKLDAGKSRPGLILRTMHYGITQVFKVADFGAAKYTADGWIKVPDLEARYSEALLRHIMAFLGGERVDPESGLHHLAHVAWGCLALMTAEHVKKSKPIDKELS